MEEHRPKKLLDQVRDTIRLKHYCYRTEQAYVGYIKCCIHFQGVRHLSTNSPGRVPGAPGVEAVLNLGDQRRRGHRNLHFDLGLQSSTQRELSAGTQTSWI